MVTNDLPLTIRLTQRQIEFISLDESLLLPAILKARINVLVSQHADGELIARICRHMGFDTVRGSSTRGGSEAVLGLMKCSRRSHLAVTPDGPRGPRRQVQIGLIFLASRTGLPIVPVGIGYARAWRLRSWDRFAIPHLWSAAACVMGRKIHVPADLKREGLERYRRLVEAEMLNTTAAAESWVETWAHQGVEAIEQYLAKYLAFLTYLDEAATTTA